MLSFIGQLLLDFIALFLLHTLYIVKLKLVLGEFSLYLLSCGDCLLQVALLEPDHALQVLLLVFYRINLFFGVYVHLL